MRFGNILVMKKKYVLLTAIAAVVDVTGWDSAQAQSAVPKEGIAATHAAHRHHTAKSVPAARPTLKAARAPVSDPERLHVVASPVQAAAHTIDQETHALPSVPPSATRIGALVL